MKHQINYVRRKMLGVRRLTFHFLLLTSHISLLTLLPSCAPQPNSFNPLPNSQPYVISLSPEPYQILNKLEEVEVTLSHPVDPKTVNDQSVYIAPGEIDKKEVKKDEIPKITGTISVAEDAQKITWHATEELASGNYSLVITTELMADNQVSFNQNPGQDPEPFVAVFHVGGEPSDPSSVSRLPSNLSPTPLLNRPSSLVINEILYDAAGSDTDGNEFIELYGTPHADIDRYQIIILNGSDGEIIDTISLPAGSKIPEDGIFLIADSRTNASQLSNIPGFDHIDNFDPQNGPDAIQLLDHQGQLLDALCYGEGNLPLARNGLESCEASPAPDVSSGHSLSRFNGADTNDNSVDFSDLSTPTPGVL